MAQSGASNRLSDGAIDTILEQKNDKPNLHPLVQVLGTKIMSNQRIRAVIFDGQTMCQHCIFLSDEIDEMYNNNQLNKYTVIRLDDYTVSSLPKKENMPVILVNKLTIMKPGDDIDHKLDLGETFSSSVQANGSSAPSRASTSTASSAAAISPARPAVPKTSTTPSKLRGATATINVITPYFNAWILRVRVVKKSPVRNYNNARGAGKLFNFDVCDESGEIRITAFNDECDKFFNLIEEGKVFLISKGEVKTANKKFNPLNNDYEITLNKGSMIEADSEAGLDIALPKICFKFIPLSELNNTAEKSLVDVIGVIRDVGMTEQLTSKKTQKELTKREIALVDKSLAEVRITLWNDEANNFTGSAGQILAIKGAMVGEFRGKTLSTGQSSIMQVEPDVPEAPLLRNWYTSQGSTQSYTSLSRSQDSGAVANNSLYACQINSKARSNNTGNTYFSINGILENTNRLSNQMYKACGYQGCKKKMTDENNGVYRCNKCNREGPTFEWMLMLSVNVMDPTGGFWITLFQENAEKLLGRSAKELAELYEQNEGEYERVVNAIRFKDYYFRAGARVEEYNNEARVKVSAFQFKPLQSNPVDRAKRLFTIIDTLSAQLNA